MYIDHSVQISILRELLFKPKARFRDLNKTDLTNDHFTFHLKKLIKIGLIEKKESHYQLTPQGLEIAGRMDIKSMKIIRQPKVGVLICITKKVSNRVEVLMGERLRDPSKGLIGFPTEKVRFGESFQETARRCLLKETGLEAEFEYRGAVHVIKYKEDFPFVDVILNYYKNTSLSVELLEETEESRNFWIPYKDAYNNFK